MRILILGAGALGSLIGVRLAQTNHQLALLTTNRQHVEAIRNDGLHIEELDGTIRRFAADAHDNVASLPGPADLIIVTVKSYDTVPAVKSIIDHCPPSTLFLTLQNGIGNWEKIAETVGREAVLVGSTAQGATLVAPGRIRHGGNGATFVGEFDKPVSKRVREVIEIFQQAGLETHAGDQMQRLIWEKLLINVGINAITALTGVYNSAVAEIEPARKLSRSAVREALEVARGAGFAIGDEILERVIAVAAATGKNRSSMGQDVDRRARTEINAINGAITAFAEKLGIPAPINRTLTQLVRTLESGYLKERSPE